MPTKPLKPCSYAGCPELTRERFCEKHNRTIDTMRGTAAQRGYDARWRKARLRYLRQYPLCAECERQRKLTAANVVDHKIPHKGDYDLFWDESNWQPLCKQCHDRKTVKADGGFGNKKEGFWIFPTKT